MHLSFPCFIITVIVKAKSWAFHLPWEPIKVIPWEGLGGALFALIHFKTPHYIANRFPSYLFPFIVDDSHIIGPSIVSFAYEHFQTKFHGISLSMQPIKCVAWVPFSLSPNFDTWSLFYTPSKGIRVLGVPLGSSSFTSSFIKDVLLEDV
jgi:hypothetical protein